MINYLKTAQDLLPGFLEYEIEQIPREQNENADALARMASAVDGEMGRTITIKFLREPSIAMTEQVLQINFEHSWMEPIYKFLLNRELPAEPIEVKKLKARAARYIIEDGYLYKIGFSKPLLRYVGNREAQELLKEVHEDDYSGHPVIRTSPIK